MATNSIKNHCKPLETHRKTIPNTGGHHRLCLEPAEDSQQRPGASTRERAGNAYPGDSDPLKLRDQLLPYLKLQIKIHDPAREKSYDDNYFFDYNCHHMQFLTKLSSYAVFDKIVIIWENCHHMILSRKFLPQNQERSTPEMSPAFIMCLLT